MGVSPKAAQSLVARYALPPEEIEARSFALIEAMLPPLASGPGEREVLRRMVHASGDPSIASLVRFHSRAVAAGVAALRAGRPIFTDVQMVAAGISRETVAGFGCEVRCAIADPEVAAKAKAWGTTRAIAAMRHFGPQLTGAIVAIGNAPTALLALLDLCDAREAAPALIVGMPVGFVAAAEAKDELAKRDVPYITLQGNRGGSPLAVAVVNALFHLAQRA